MSLLTNASGFFTSLYNSNITLSTVSDTIHIAANEVIQNGLFNTASKKITQVYKSAKTSLGEKIQRKFLELHSSLTRPEPAPTADDIRIYGQYIVLTNTLVYLKNALPVALR